MDNYTCGKKYYATCVYYELPIPTISSLANQDCVTIEQTTQDLYQLVENLNTNISVSGLQLDCFNELPNDFTLLDVVQQQANKICELESQIETLNTQSICDQSIEDCGLDLTGVLDNCDEPITTLGQYLQFVINSINQSGLNTTVLA